MLEFILMIALLINGVMLLIDKIGLLDWLQMRIKSDFIYKMLNCNFCLAHHLTLLFLIPLFLLDFNYLYFAIPLMVAGLIHTVR